MHRIFISWLLIAGLTMLSGCGERKAPVEEAAPEAQPTEGTVLASVESRVITLEKFNAQIDAYNNEVEASQDIPDSAKPNYLIKAVEDKKRLLEGMVERELLIVEALKMGMDKEQDLLQTLEALKEQLLFSKIVEAEKAKVGVTAKEIESYYVQHQEMFKTPEERKVSMIVLPNEEKAQQILVQFLKGGDFAVLAKANSIDQSAAEGGDIGFIVEKTAFVQPEQKTMFQKFEEVAFTLELNKPSAVFQGPAGFYIIKVSEIKRAEQKLLSQVYNNIQRGLLLKKQDEALQTLIENLRQSTSIVVYDNLLKE